MINYSIKKDPATNIDFITLENGTLKATFLNFGARMYEFFAPDKNGLSENIFLSIQPKYLLDDPAQFGALVGPVAGRIKKGQWKEHQFELNNGQNHLHGGSKGWWNQFWDYQVEEHEKSISVTFKLIDTSSGYPGPIKISNTYELTTDAIIMTTHCISDQDTIVNPTNHVYFNLSGNAKRDITSHILQINARKLLETDTELIPTGQVLPVAGTPYDFSKGNSLKEALIKIPAGIDDAFWLDDKSPQIILSEQESGRRVTISGNRQAVVVFTATGLDLDLPMTFGDNMHSQAGIALETQELPDIVNHPEWGSIDLKNSEEKVFQTIYQVTTF